jgi:hypothetical protein
MAKVPRAVDEFDLAPIQDSKSAEEWVGRFGYGGLDAF